MEKYNNAPLTFKIPVLGFAAYSGTGKTTLLVKLLPLMKLQGLRVALIKHTHHDFDIDKPGKDSFELRKAGANQVLLASDKRSALLTEYDQQKEPDIATLIDKLDLNNLDLVLVEGFRHLPFAKIELHRPATEKPLLFTEDRTIIAVASDENIETGGLPLLNINAPEEIAGFINRWHDNQGLKPDNLVMNNYF
ncbi:MAG: molybdopterin-guanine dinucleotide biosynthesis protein B [Gammaproteobacteria bacterium]|nr:molybdopterin-guanine dinucleotide biosynthesis protein B [Gammaproteobacteria bacterium]